MSNNEFNWLGSFEGTQNVVDYGDKIVYDEVSHNLINNLIVYFERHNRQLTDICMSVNNLKKLEKSFILHFGKRAAGTFKWSAEGFLLESSNWGINFHSIDTRASRSEKEGNEVINYPSGDDMVYAYDWTDTGDPWAVEVSVNPDAEPPNVDEVIKAVEDEHMANVKALLEIKKQLDKLKDTGV